MYGRYVDEEEDETLFDLFSSAVFGATPDDDAGSASLDETIRDIFELAEEIEAADGDDVTEEEVSYIALT